MARIPWRRTLHLLNRSLLPSPARPAVSFCLVLIVGAKLQYIIIDLAIEVRGGLKKIDLDHLDDGLKKADHPGEGVEVQSMKPRDDLFWFSRPKILIKLIHFILFQNAFELAFFFWALFTYGFNSCLMG